MSSSEDFFVLKRFERESTRVALWMQDRIAQLSEELDRVDKYYEENGDHCGRFRVPYPEGDARLQILAKMQPQLKEYRKFQSPCLDFTDL